MPALKMRAVSMLLAYWVSTLALAATDYSSTAEAYQSGAVARAEQSFSQLSSEGNVHAMYALAVMHLKNETQKPSLASAVLLLTEAAAQGHAPAQFNLAVLYWTGKGVAKNEQIAVNYWKLAAQQEDPGAQYNLGLYYLNQEKTEQQQNLAYEWLVKAASNEHPQAKMLLLSDQIDFSRSKPAASVSAKSDLIVKKTTQANKSKQNLNQATIKATVKPATLITEAQVTYSATELDVSVRTDVPATSNKQGLSSIANNAPEQKHTIGSNVTLRSRPTETAFALTQLPGNTPITEIKRKNNWVKVRHLHGFPAWVHTDLIKRTSNTTGVITAKLANIRPRPALDTVDAAPVGQLKKGTVVRLLKTQGEWAQINAEAKLGAWVKSSQIHNNHNALLRPNANKSVTN